MATFKVLSSTQNQKGGFVWKLQTITPVKVFGIEKSVTRTYYIGGMPAAATVGSELKEDLNKFDITEREFAHPETGEQLMLKWLHAKVS